MEQSFGVYLAKVLRYHNLNQKQAAMMLHISPQSLNNYILDKRLPDMNTMKHIIKYFHIDANHLFYETKDLEFSQLGFDEIELLNLYRQLDEKHKHYVIAVIKNIPV